MALISCPECGKQISDAAPACPHCGYQLSVASAPTEIHNTQPTKIGENEQDLAGGIGLLLIAGFGAFFIGGGFIPMQMPIKIFFFVITSILAGIGFARIAGYRTVTCPNCGKEGKAGNKFESYECPVCKKRSIRKGKYLNPLT